MSNFNDISNIWQNAPAPVPGNVPAILKGVKKKRMEAVKRSALCILSLLGAGMVVGWVGLYYHARYFTTYVGIVMVLVAIILGVFFQSKILQYMTRPIDIAADNMAFLIKMKEYRKKQHYLHTTGNMLYFILLSVGMFLYLFEFTYGSTTFIILTYGLTFAWVGFAWFYLRPRTIRKETQKLNSMIEELERVVKQMEG